MLNFKTVFLSVLTTAALLLSGGCNYNADTAEVHDLYDHGDFQQAAQIAADQAAKAEKRDKLLYYLEAGAIERAASHPDQSLQTLDVADQIYTVYEMGADVRISQEFAATAVNDTVMDYTGYSYDGIMMNTYKALDALDTGDLDRMRVELTRAYQREQDAVARHQKEIAALNQQAAAPASSGQDQQLDVNQAQSDPQFQQNFQQQYSDLNVENLSGYANYVNPFTEYLRGMYLMYAGVDSSDTEQGSEIMRRLAGIVRGNQYINEDAVLADQIANGHQPLPTTYVIYEAGLAPERQEIKIGFPLILRGGQRGGTYQIVEAAFPKLVKRPCYCQELTVQAGAANFPTIEVCDLDKVIEQEFKNDLPAVITRALISAAVKAIAQYATERAADNSNGYVAALTAIGSTIAVHESTHADRRTWKSLPKVFSVAKIPTPADRNIQLTFANGQVVPVHVNDGTINIVYVKCVREDTQPVIRQSKLK